MSDITLRDYQRASVEAVWQWIAKRDDAPAVVLPTGAGKTPVIAQLARDAVGWGGRVLILAHVQELLGQAYETLQAMLPEHLMDIGLYSAGLGRRDTDQDILVAGVQSVHRRAEQMGRRDVVLVDEAHLIPHDGDSMYRRLLTDLRVVTPHCRLVGLTATPYRLDRGRIYGPDQLFGGICYEAPIRDLVDQGYLSRLVGVQETEADLEGVHIRGGDYVASELDELLSVDDVVIQAAQSIVHHCRDRKSWLVFASGVRHAERVQDELRRIHGIEAELLTGQTPQDDRQDLVARLKSRHLRCVVNVNVASIGFDAKCIDAVVLLRPTQSPGLYYQQVGRGLRIAPGKRDCLILDMAGNIRRHGPIDQIRPPPTKEKRQTDKPGRAPAGKTCPQCSEIVAGATMVCPHCGYEWPPKHEANADPNAKPMTEYEEAEWGVRGVEYRVWTKKGFENDPDKPKTLCAEYDVGDLYPVREWVCPEHQGFARGKFEQWWAPRDLTGGTPPTVALDALDQLDELHRIGEWIDPIRIRVRVGGRFPEVVGYVFDMDESATPVEENAAYDPGEEVPF